MFADRDPKIVVVAYRNTLQLAAALGSLGAGHELLVVDNGADDDVRKLVGEYGGTYLTAGRNIGFAAGVNLALAESEGKDVLLLNPDARISPELPRALMEILATDSRIGAVAPRLEDGNGEPQRVEWPIPSPREAWIDALMLRSLFPPRRVFLIGAVLLISGEALRDIGGFDERFFLYAEECDWQLRAVLGGWRLRQAETLLAMHSGSGSSEDESVRKRYFYESAALFGRKWYGRNGWASMRSASLVGTSLRLCASLFRPKLRARYARQLRL